jgi:hypothetical protein
MNVLSRLWRAVAGLAESVEALAGTVGEANGRLRQRLALDGAGASPGEVIDQGPAAEALPAPRRNGRKATG